jgi:predicted XRE-type DNA-binding protein
VRFAAAVFVLHVFQKKAKRGIATPMRDMELIKERLKAAEQIVKSKRKARDVDVEMGSGNVYADLRYDDADEMLIKAQLVAKIAEIIKRKGITQTQAAALLEMPQPKLSNLFSGRFRGVSERRLMDCLTKLGRDVQIVVKSAPRSRGSGRLSIVFS